MLEKLKNAHIPAQELINTLKSIAHLDKYYQQTVRHYLLENHTIIVLNEFDKYFVEAEIFIDRILFRLLLALHDIGKHKAFIEGNKDNQYKNTMIIINSVRQHLPFSEKDIDLCICTLRATNRPVFSK